MLTKIKGSMLDPSAVSDRLGYTPVNKAGDTMTGNLTVPERIELFTDGINGTQRHGRISATSSPNNPYAGGVKLEYYNFNGSSYQFYDGLLINGAGCVTMPNQPAFRAGAVGGAQTIAASYQTNFMSDTSGLGYNIGGYYNTSTSKFTAPISGRYLFWLGLFQIGTAYDRWGFAINGGYLSYPYAFAKSGPDGSADSGSAILNLTAGDYVTIGAQYGGSQIYGGHSAWGGYLLG